jgi:hypothetical protein
LKPPTISVYRVQRPSCFHSHPNRATSTKPVSPLPPTTVSSRRLHHASPPSTPQTPRAIEPHVVEAPRHRELVASCASAVKPSCLSGTSRVAPMPCNSSRASPPTRPHLLALLPSSCHGRTQVKGPTCTCPCPTDLRRLCMCTKELNKICLSVPRTTNKPLITRIAGLSKHSSYTNICSGTKFFILK